MTLPPLDERRARELVARFDGLPVLVAGDVMVDRFIVGHVSRISPEAPVPVVQFQSEHVRLGGAANVAHNIAVLGGRVSLVAVVGADATAQRLRQQLSEAGIRHDGLVEAAGRPTTEKVRIVTDRNHQVARVDYEHDGDVSGAIERAVVEQIERLGHDARALLVSDYLKGAITRPVIEALIAISRSAKPSGFRSPESHASDGEARQSAGRAEAAADRQSIPLIVDPKIPHLACYRGATLVTPNHYEAETATHRRIRTDEDARDAARDFRTLAGCEAVLITRGEHGMWLSENKAEGAVTAVAREVADVTGAGDTVVATLALALAAGATLGEAALLANQAAGIVIGKFGPATVTPDELLATFRADT